MTSSEMQKLQERIKSSEALMISKHEKREAFYKEAEEQGCSWYEIQMLRKQDILDCRLINIRDALHRLEEKN